MRRLSIITTFFLLAATGRGPLEFVALDGAVVELAQPGIDASLILHFWATWCPSCAEEMRLLDSEVAACAPGRVRVVAVNVDEDVDTIRKYWTKHDLELNVVRDPGGDEWRRLGGTGLPFNLIKSGDASRTLSGPRDAAAWREVLAELGCERSE